MDENQRIIEILIRYWDDYIPLQALLYNSPTANAVWDILPVKKKVQFWGDEMFFSIPVIARLEGVGSDVVNEGDICFWPQGRCLCLFFGPTPISSEDGKIRATGPVNKIGRLRSDYKDKIFSDVSSIGRVRKRYFIIPSNSIIKIQKIGEKPHYTKRNLKLTKFYVLRTIQALQNRLKIFLRGGKHR